MEPNGEVHYVVEYKREDSRSWTSIDTVSNNTHYNLTGLHSGSSYTIRVVAVNSAGRAKSMPAKTTRVPTIATSSSAATPTSSSAATPTSSSTVTPTSTNGREHSGGTAGKYPKCGDGDRTDNGNMSVAVLKCSQEWNTKLL